MTSDERERAIRNIRAKRAFWKHLSVYVIVNAFLVGVWYFGAQGPFWPGWSILGWGVGLGFHRFGVFVGNKPISEADIQREIDKNS